MMVEQMINYDSLIENACNEFPKVRELYSVELKNDSIDFDSGVHTVFSFCFVPVLKEAILNDDALAQRMFDYLEKMEICEDNLVGEVAEFTVLEEILDDFELNKLRKYMGKFTIEAATLINRYINQ